MPTLFRLPLCSLFAATLLVGAVGTAQAQARESQERQARAAQATWPRGQDGMSDSIRRVRNESRGQVLSAERMHMDGREINRIKVMDERGRVRVYEDDPHRRGSAEARPRTRGRDD
ncbi:hypothetical protein [Luteimonas abyssi]|uniref:hypothetical protein n=1 Tax=Luteimonas abyssi TaxID=1247514 RepID=UPI000AD9127F|nr:hypothetical protein [Luteimonas abyssi]